MNDVLCQKCKKNIAKNHLKLEEDRTLALCSDCFNLMMADMLDIEIEPFNEKIYSFEDHYGVIHEFMISRHISPLGLGFEAVEVGENDEPGRKVSVMDDIECNQRAL